MSGLLLTTRHSPLTKRLMRALYHHRTQGRDVEAVHIRGLADGLERLGCAVQIVGPPGVDADPNRVETPRTGRLSAWARIARGMPQLCFEMMEVGYNLVAAPRLWARCRMQRPALIYERYALYNAAGVLAGAFTGTPVVLEVNDTVHMDRTRQGKRLRMPWLAAWFEQRIFNRAAALMVVSSYLRDHLVERGFSAQKICVTPNAVDAERFDPTRVDGALIRERCGLTGRCVVGFAGCFAKWHGVEFLVRVAASLAKQLPELGLLMVGDGPRLSEAEALAAELGIAERTVFTGKVPHADMPAYVAAMDIGVMPASNAFGSPMKVFEYMAMGRPAVAPRYRPLEEAIDDGTTGLLFQPDDADGLAACLRTLAVDPELRQAMGAAARQKVHSQHLWIHNAAVVLDQVAARRKRSEEPASPARTKAESA